MTKDTISGGVVHELPEDLRITLAADAEALAAWEDLTPLARNEWICWTISVKKPETRTQHVERVRTELLTFQETLRQRANEVSEVQRMHEERIKRIIEEAQSTDEKRWGTQAAKFSEQWQGHERTHAKQEERIAAAKDAIPAPITESIDELRADYDKVVKTLFDAVASLMESKRSTLPSVSISPATMPEDGGGSGQHGKTKRH